MPEDNDIQVAANQRVEDLLAPIPRFTSRCVAAIAFGPLSERPRNVATVTAVKVAGALFLVTAKHVVDSGPAEEFPWRILLPPRDGAGRVVDRPPGSPQTFTSGSTEVIWRSTSSDVAILRPPSGLRIDSFDGAVAAGVTRKVREDWDAAASKDAYRPVVISGFPLFARDLTTASPLYGLISLSGFIVGADRPAAHVPTPRLSLNLGCTQMKAEWSSEPEGPLFARQLESDDGSDPLAGLSGAPVAVVTENGFHLVGIFFEGTRRLESGFAVPWDVVEAEFSDSLMLSV